MNNLKLAFRTLFKTPFVTSVAILSLALGIGANSAIYSLFDQMLLRPLPVHEPSALVNLSAPGPKPGSTSCNQAGGCDDVFSYAMFRDLERAQQVFTGLAAHRTFGANFAYRGQTLNGSGELVSGSYFPLLGVHPALGRLIGPDDDRAIGEAPVVVLTHNYWRTRFDSNPNVINDTLIVNGQALTIIGVAPAGFDGTTLGTRLHVFVPITLRGSLQPTAAKSFERRDSYWAYLFARLKPGVSIEEAHTALNMPYRAIINDVEAPLQKGMSDQTMARFRARQVGVTAGARGQSQLHRDARAPLLILLGVTGFVLLIACANVANLLLARAAGRQREFAIRRALGAGTGRIVAQLVAESSALALAAGLLALILTMWTIDLVAGLVPSSVVAVSPISVDTSVIVFGVAVAVISVLVFGLAPALHAATSSLNPQLRDNAANTTASPKRQRVRSILAVAQCALALVLLIGATLLVRTFQELNRVDLGFSAENVLAVRVWMPQPNIPSTGPYFRHDQRLPFLRAVEARLRALGAVDNVGWTTHVPLTPARSQPFLVEGRPLDERSVATTEITLASAASFDVLGIPLRRGRMFTDADTADAAPVALVNETFVRRYFPDEDAIGRRIRPGGPSSTAPWRTIVGVVGDVRSRQPDLPPGPQIFGPTTQSSSLAMAIVIRTRGGDAATLADAIRREVRRVDPEMPVYGIEKLDTVVARSTGQRRFAATLLFCFAGFALVLAAVGLYAVIAYLVSQRTHEIGLRMALGAQKGDVLRMVLAYGAGLAAAGIAIGLVAAVPMSRMLQSLLFGVSTTDPATFVLLPLGLCAVALLACYLPARRAININPIDALRQN